MPCNEHTENDQGKTRVKRELVEWLHQWLHQFSKSDASRLAEMLLKKLGENEAKELLRQLIEGTSGSSGDQAANG